MLENKHASAKSDITGMERTKTICRCNFGPVHNIETVFYIRNLAQGLVLKVS